MLPCHVIVQELKEGKLEVAAATAIMTLAGSMLILHIQQYNFIGEIFPT